VHRNVLLLDVNPGNNNKVYHHKDRYSAPQVIYDIAAKDTCSLDSLLKAYEKTIIGEMYERSTRGCGKHTLARRSNFLVFVSFTAFSIVLCFIVRYCKYMTQVCQILSH